MVANEVLVNPNLSFKAKGLYAYLFSKPDTWDFSSHRMVLETKDGRRAIMGMLKELEDSGYLLRQRLSTGKVEYTLTFSHKSLGAEKALGDEKPKCYSAQVLKRLGAETAPISNIYNTSNKEEKVIPIAETSSAPFDFKVYLKEMEDHKSRHINVIGLYFEEKGIKFDSREKAGVAVKRHLRAAQDVSKFSDKEILDAVDKAKKQYEDLWTIETIKKILTR